VDRELATVWIRFGALVIDGLIIVPFYIPLWVLNARIAVEQSAEPDFTLLGINVLILFIGVGFGLWNTIYRMGKTGQSLGRKFLNIAVLDANGSPIGVGRAALREIIGRWVSGIVCYIGYLNAFWDNKRQMWHDKMANCYVYYVEEKFS
jgi:uncharacterized RDD family membrane protein YckC